MRTVLFLLAVWVVVSAPAAVVDRVAVVVGNDVITEGEVLDELRLQQFMTSQPLDFSPQKRHEAAERLVDQQLIRREIEVAHYKEPSPADADSMLRNFRREHFHNDAEYRAALQKYGITEDQLKQYLLWQLTALRFTDERFHPNVAEGPESSANREVPPPAPAAGRPANGPALRPPGLAPQQSADRLARGASSQAGQGNVDQQLDAWLKEARSNTRIEFKKEAFQ